jgi:hypothetical protein
MSDIVLGALIGFGAAALGSIITSIFNYINAKSQINARHEEMSLQQKYNEQQARAGRLIKARENVLIQLRQVISKWMQVTAQYQRILVRLSDKINDDPEKLASEIQDSDRKVMAESKKVASDLEVLQGQISDSKLDQLIETAKRVRESAGPQAMKIRQLLTNPQSSEGSGKDPLKHEMEGYFSNLKKLHGHLLSINKRIEDLLSGEPSS